MRGTRTHSRPAHFPAVGRRCAPSPWTGGEDRPRTGGMTMMLTANQIRCLLVVLSLTRIQEYVASKDVAKLLGITRPSVHKALEVLSAKGLIEKEPYGSARLTAQGQALAERLEERKERLQLLFAQAFGLSLDESGLAATLLMSGLREESLEKLEQARA